MATSSMELIEALRQTAQKLESGATYHWGHMGACNCGNLAQELLQVSKAEIHAWALESREGDWSEQTEEYCATSNLPMDLMLRKMLDKGLTAHDLRHLEKLSSPQIIAQLPESERELNYHHKADVIRYLKAWASLLENSFLEDVNIDGLFVENRSTTKVAP